MVSKQVIVVAYARVTKLLQTFHVVVTTPLAGCAIHTYMSSEDTSYEKKEKRSYEYDRSSSSRSREHRS